MHSSRNIRIYVYIYICIGFISQIMIYHWARDIITWKSSFYESSQRTVKAVFSSYSHYVERLVIIMMIHMYTLAN